jgi:hypothetical protein
MKSELYDAVAWAFRRLIEANVMRIESSSYDRREFGNASVVLAGSRFRVQLTRDRGEVDATVSSYEDPNDWYPLEWIVAAATGTPAPPPRTTSPQLAAEFVEAHFDEIRSAFTDTARGTTKSRHDVFVDDRIRLFH